MAQGYHWPRLVSYPSLFPKMSMLRYNSMCSYCCLRWLETMASEEDTARQCRCQVGFNQLSGRTELSFLEFSYLHLSGFRKRHLWEFIHCWNQSEAKLEKIFFSEPNEYGLYFTPKSHSYIWRDNIVANVISSPDHSQPECPTSCAIYHAIDGVWFLCPTTAEDRKHLAKRFFSADKSLFLA